MLESMGSQLLEDLIQKADLIGKMLENLCGLLNKGVRWSLGGMSLAASSTRLI